jgi:FtsH-binding integral membrane protein
MVCVRALSLCICIYSAVAASSSNLHEMRNTHGRHAPHAATSLPTIGAPLGTQQSVLGMTSAPAHAALLSLRGGQREPRFPATSGAPVGIQQSTLSKTTRCRPQDDNINLDATVEELEQQEAKYADAFLVRDSRLGFIRKVYAALTCQLAFTAGACLLAGKHKRELLPWLLQGQGERMQTVFWSSFAVSLGSIVALQSKKELRQKAPANIALLSLFTVAESAAVSCITLLYQTKSVWLALLQTSAATLGLSLYAFNTNPKYDLSGIGSACSSGLIILLLFGVLRMVFPG